MKSSDNILTIAISTLAVNLPSVLDYVRNVCGKLPLGISFIIVSQLEDVNRDEKLSDSILLVKRTSRGLSKSRNVAIDYCLSTWIWFQDDDINLVLSRIAALIDFLEATECDFVLGQVGSLEDKSQSFKDYSRYNVNSTFLSFRISSIEIVARMIFLKKNRIKFDENLGLGSHLPSCEENLFFYDAVVRNKASYCFYDKNICLHTKIFESRNINYEGRYKARGYLLGRTLSINSPLILVWWSIRKTKDRVSRFSRLNLMLQGALAACEERRNK